MSPSSGPAGGPLLVALEGIDGSGTSTQADLLAERLGRVVPKVLVTREPSSGPVGRLIRRLLRGEGGHLDSAYMALLFAADRREHVVREIDTALSAGAWVVADRYVWSSFAYQSLELPLEWVRSLNRYARSPDFVVILDVPVEVAMERLASRAFRDVFEKRELQVRIREQYLELARRDEKALVVDGTMSKEAVLGEILAGLSEYLVASGRGELAERLGAAAGTLSTRK